MDYNLKNISEEFFSSAYHEFFGEPFAFDFTPIYQCINPWHFVKCREVRGGTGDKAMKSMIDRAKKEVEACLLYTSQGQIWFCPAFGRPPRLENDLEFPAGQ